MDRCIESDSTFRSQVDVLYKYNDSVEALHFSSQTSKAAIPFSPSKAAQDSHHGPRICKCPTRG